MHIIHICPPALPHKGMVNVHSLELRVFVFVYLLLVFVTLKLYVLMSSLFNVNPKELFQLFETVFFEQ